jgi:hypothetical protein
MQVLAGFAVDRPFAVIPNRGAVRKIGAHFVVEGQQQDGPAAVVKQSAPFAARAAGW